LAASALPVAASKSTTRGRETLKHQWAVVGCKSATPERQQPTANEWLLAASALPVAASQRSTTAATTYNQWAVVGCKSATPERQQPTAIEWLLAARARAPHEAERHWGTNERLLTIESKLLDKATATMGPNSYGT
jgi:hypothetical protein